MPLTDPKVKNAPRRAKPYKLADGQGMYLLVRPDGSKYWRLKYRYAGKEKVLALGVYDEVGLKEARARRDEARTKLAKGIDPSAERKSEKMLRRYKAANTFEAVGREWYENQRAQWSDVHAASVLAHLERRLFPKLGNEPVATVDAPKLLMALRAVESGGALEMASKTRIVAGQVLAYAIRTGRATSNPARELKGVLKAREQRHYARLDERDLPAFLEKLDAYDGSIITRLAMKLLVLTFVRTGELRGAKWSEFDFDKREWKIPGERMKSGRIHVVPLSRQAVDVLEELRPITGHAKGGFVFPNEHHEGKSMSENTILFALYRMGYRGRATGHGFRATASTILNEQGWDADVIERQLAHKEKDEVRAAYHHSEYMPERRKMMQAWADFLDAKQAEGDKVVSIQRKRAEATV